MAIADPVVAGAAVAGPAVVAAAVAGAGVAGSGAAPMLLLDGFEGPLDLLLDLARSQKVDLAPISILTLVDQYLAVLDRAPVELEIAADWLVMAAWLAWLKSRLLLPDDPVATEEGELAGEALQRRLLELARIGEAALLLEQRPQLGRDVFARVAGETLCRVDRSGLVLDLGQLLGAYMVACRRAARHHVYRPRPPQFWTVSDALQRLRRLLGDQATLDWCPLDRFLPAPGEFADGGPGRNERAGGDPADETGRARRAALAGTLLAGLELARSGVIELRQDRAFGPVLLRMPPADAPADADTDAHADPYASGAEIGVA